MEKRKWSQRPTPKQEDICNWYLLGKEKTSFPWWGDTGCIKGSAGLALFPGENDKHKITQCILCAFIYLFIYWGVVIWCLFLCFIFVFVFLGFVFLFFEGAVLREKNHGFGWIGRWVKGVREEKRIRLKYTVCKI